MTMGFFEIMASDRDAKIKEEQNKLDRIRLEILQQQTDQASKKINAEIANLPVESAYKKALTDDLNERVRVSIAEKTDAVVKAEADLKRVKLRGDTAAAEEAENKLKKTKVEVDTYLNLLPAEQRALEMVKVTAAEAKNALDVKDATLELLKFGVIQQQQQHAMEMDNLKLKHQGDMNFNSSLDRYTGAKPATKQMARTAFSRGDVEGLDVAFTNMSNESDSFTEAESNRRMKEKMAPSGGTPGKPLIYSDTGQLVGDDILRRMKLKEAVNQPFTDEIKILDIPKDYRKGSWSMLPDNMVPNSQKRFGVDREEAVTMGIASQWDAVKSSNTNVAIPANSDTPIKDNVDNNVKKIPSNKPIQKSTGSTDKKVTSQVPKDIIGQTFEKDGKKWTVTKDLGNGKVQTKADDGTVKVWNFKAGE